MPNIFSTKTVTTSNSDQNALSTLQALIDEHTTIFKGNVILHLFHGLHLTFKLFGSLKVKRTHGECLFARIIEIFMTVNSIEPYFHTLDHPAL